MITHPQAASGSAVVIRVRRKSGGSIRCVCGHRRDEHCGASPCPHDKRDKYGRRLEFDHCLLCGCGYFTGPKKANLSTQCGNPGCQHPKKDHCWNIPRRLGGQGPHAHHFWPHGSESWWQCLGNHCVVKWGWPEVCTCTNFVDPYAKPKKLKKSKTDAEKQLLEVFHDFSPVTVPELVEASGRSASWVRRTLKANGLKAAKAPRRKATTAPAATEEGETE